MKAPLLLSMCFLLGGCLTRPPVIAVDSVEIVERNETAMALHYNLVLTNPNDKPIEPLEFTYSVSVAGRGVYSGRHAAEMTLDAGGQKRPLALPAVIPYDLAGWTNQTVPDSARWSLSGTLVYVDEGVFAETLLDLGYRPSTSFAASGDLTTITVLPEPGPPAPPDSSAQSSLPDESAGS
ncbi:MAG: hypothetical protein P8J89_06920 [Phycisphaerales bacterium]|nr:hypothetical protein [Phycisphaerales bacterium]|tara:strand:- start:7427 stop:7966 length:540 start_codon:yes stop_codon:yes gene_type:complete